MSYMITYNSIDGLTGMYAVVRRKLDGNYWNGTGWVSDSQYLLAMPLSESTTIPGEYSHESGINPVNGGVYVVSIYSSAGVLLFESECLYQSRQEPILKTINTVQRWLRLPESGVITEGHAALLLGFANEVQLDYLADTCQWPEMRLRGAFTTSPGISVYSLSPLQGGKVDSVTELRIGTSEAFQKPSTDDFRYKIRVEKVSGQPDCYNNYGKAGKSLLIEVYPIPDGVYRVDFELLQKPAELVNAEDIPLLDQDALMLGIKYLVRKDQGEEFAPELATFQAKLALLQGTHGESQDTELDFL